MDDVTNLSVATFYAKNIFNLLNGKVNYVIPAKQLLFGNTSMSSNCMGDTILDVVEINIPNIYSICHEEDGWLNPDKIRGCILYTIVHELLHIDQDSLKYMDILKQENQYDAQIEETILESACHAMTFEVLNQLLDGPFWYDQPSSSTEILIPQHTNYINDTQEDQLYCWRNSYYRVTNPCDKGIYCLNDFCGVDFREYINYNTCNYAIIYIYWNEVYMGGGYVYYLNRWLAPQYIFDILRPLGLVSKTDRPYKSNVIVKTYKSDTNILKIFEVNITMENNTLEIIDQH